MMKNLITADIIHKIETECFDEPWSPQMIKAHLNTRAAVTLIKTRNGIPVGYAAGIRLDGESELYRIAVLPDYRGQGYAKELLARFIERCGKSGGEIFLEVRSQNSAAIALYESAGFARVGVRKGYYGDDDAAVYRLAK